MQGGSRMNSAKEEGGEISRNTTGRHSSKKRRLSDENGWENDSASSHPDAVINNQEPPKELCEAYSAPRSPEIAKASLDERHNFITTGVRDVEDSKPKAQTSKIIDLEDERDNSQVPRGQQTEVEIQATEPQKAAEVILRDEEFPELARKAREKAQRKRLAQDVVSSPGSSRTGLNGEFFRLYHIPPSTPPSPPPDPVLQILITSDIENTQPLIVNRRLSQRLKDVRLAWAERQGFARDLIETLFLTWRGKRLFDVTSCKSLGISVDADGRVHHKGDVLGDEEGRVHMEVMTPELLENYKKTKRDAKTREEGESPNFQQTAPSRKGSETQVKVILKAKGFDDFKLIVKPILNAFRTTNGIQAEKDVFLQFDGESLSPQSKIEETEISDMDHIDVYVK
ncbi:MAG: hypothetical protein Q9164_001311 [Protoblastenia rupestris]